MENNPISAICASCGAPVTPVKDKNYFVCSYCGAYYFPEASQDGVKIMGEPGTLFCPVCKIPMVTAMIEDIHIEACSKCRGVMISQNQLAFVVQLLRETSKKVETALPLDKAGLDPERYCQSCGRKMDSHPYGGGGNVVIDVCETCGVVWFDYGELKRIMTAPDFGVSRDEREGSY